MEVMDKTVIWTIIHKCKSA